MAVDGQLAHGRHEPWVRVFSALGAAELLTLLFSSVPRMMLIERQPRALVAFWAVCCAVVVGALAWRARRAAPMREKESHRLWQMWALAAFIAGLHSRLRVIDSVALRVLGLALAIAPAAAAWQLEKIGQRQRR